MTAATPLTAAGPRVGAYDHIGSVAQGQTLVQTSYPDSAQIALGDGADALIDWNGTLLRLLGAVDDQQFAIGDGTKSWDLKLWGNTTNDQLSWDASAGILKLEDNNRLHFGTNGGVGPGNVGDATLGWDATILSLLAAADDSVLKIGNGTNSWDLWLYGNVAGDYLLWDASASQLSLQGAATMLMTGMRRQVVSKGADYPVVVADSGKLFVATAAVNFTLPAVASSTGVELWFVQASANAMTITGPAVSTLVVFNDAAANSYAFSTGGSEIGEAVHAICDGSLWYLLPTQTVAAAPATVTT